MPQNQSILSIKTLNHILILYNNFALLFYNHNLFILIMQGTSTNNNLVPFRDCYSRLHELRSLAPAVHMIALTATATKTTRETIFDVLLMDNPCVIFESPNKDNIAYVVEYMPKDVDLEHYFAWLIEELREKKELCDRTILYCQTIKQCGLLYATIRAMLGNDMCMLATQIIIVLLKCYIHALLQLIRSISSSLFDKSVELSEF